jgi:polyhydroxybutyrate depolymerase
MINGAESVRIALGDHRSITNHQEPRMLQLIFAIASATVLSIGLDPPEPAASRVPDEAEQRIGNVSTYLMSGQKPERASALRELGSDSLADVAAALAEVRLWPDIEPGFSTRRLTVSQGTNRAAKSLDVEIHIPEGYDAKTAYPLLIAYHGQGGDGKQFIRASLALLGEQAKNFIVAAPTDYDGMWLGSSAVESEEPRAGIDQLKRLVHVDTDRVYVMGYSLGGHASFLMATLYKDSITAAVPLAGTCAIQMGSECLDLLLPNIRSTPVLAVYGADDQSKDAATNEPAGIAVWNRYIKQQTARLNLPITMIELPGVGHGGVIPPKDALGDILSAKRAPLSKTVAHRFRYTTQARDGWLRQTQFSGDPWTSQQLIISPANGETAAEAMAAMLREKLGYIGGTIEGQIINIETHFCGRIEVLLNDDLVDLDQPITIIVDGTVRFEGVAKRNIETMLDIARQDWEFQRLFPVRFQIGQKSKAIQR